MVFSRGLVISLGVSALSATLLFLYFRNRMQSVERKVDVMFDLIQTHQQSDRQSQMSHQMMMQQNNAPSSQNTGEWVNEDNRTERNLIDVSDDEDDEEYDSEDSREVSDNEDDLEERIKLVTTDIDLVEANEAKSVVVLESNNDETVEVDNTIELQEVTNELEEDIINNDNNDDDNDNDNDNDNVEQLKKTSDDDIDSLEDDSDEDDSDEEDENTLQVKQPSTIDYSKLKVTELKAIAEAKGLTSYKKLKKQPLIDLIKAAE